MRGVIAVLVAALVAVGACGNPAVRVAPMGTPLPQMPRLLPPTPIDPKAPAAAYLTTVAMQLQAGWGQFLDDCRLRLPAQHPLNRMALATTVELVVDRKGRIVELHVAASGNADFDKAVRDAINDAAPLVAPPQELLSDDDQLHLRWLFARDRRQAGPATAEVVHLELPLAGVIDRLIDARDLARAARRLGTAPAGDVRTAAVARVMVAALREALGSADGSVRRAAVEAIALAHATELVPDVRALLTATTDNELRILAMGAAAELGDGDAVEPLLVQLRADLAEHPRLAVAEARALVKLGHLREAAALVLAEIEKARGEVPSTIALEAFAVAPARAVAPQLAGWFRRGDARTRAAVCAALVAVPDVAWVSITRGLGDGDATVRARCTDAATTIAASLPRTKLEGRLRDLARDRDRGVRARAVAALVALDASPRVNATDDVSAVVRSAYARALAKAPPSEADSLRTLIDDRDPDVRAAAWTALAALPVAPADRAQLAVRAMTDAAPQVRIAAVAAVDDDDVLVRLVTGEDSAELRTTALVQLAGRRGRAAILELVLDRLAGSAVGSADRVRTALAWLLAR